jgi:hypothetical protein
MRSLVLYRCLGHCYAIQSRDLEANSRQSQLGELVVISGNDGEGNRQDFNRHMPPIPTMSLTGDADLAAETSSTFARVLAKYKVPGVSREDLLQDRAGPAWEWSNLLQER